MTSLVLMGESLRINAQLYRDKLAARDLSRAMTFMQWNERACRLANALLGMGLRKGDRVAILAFNCIEWLEFYAATAKAGLIMVPINFRLLGAEIAFIVDDCEAKAFIVQSDLLDRVEQVREQLSVASGNYIHFGGGPAPSGYKAYEDLIAAGSAQEPSIQISPEDTWALMYTSGTTGRPKGAMRSHGSQALSNLVTLCDMEFSRNDTCLLAMPMCHANSLFFACAFAYAGASCVIYNSKSFDPEHFLRALSEQNATFTSLVPTQYIMMLSLPQAVRAKHNVDCVSKLLISSAPAREDLKRAIMEAFRNSRLMELYGSTEQGWVTLLRPDEQITKLGSIGREYTGSGRIKILDESGNEVPDGEAGELYSRTPWCFDGYWKMPEKTAEAFRGPYLTVGDMARRDEQGYYYLVDRKSNMIISGGENVYPSEIENALGAHPKIKDVAVIGRAHAKWGESVHAVIVLQDGASATEEEIIAWCADRMAGYKRPRSASFIGIDDMPRTATGKILHRVLRERLKEKG